MNQDNLSIFLNNFDHMDSAIFHPELGLHGTTLCVDCQLWGEKDENGFIVDFGLVKTSIKAYLKEFLDHKLIVFAGNDQAQVDYQDDRVSVVFMTGDGEFKYSCPSQAIHIVNESTQTPVQYLQKSIEKKLSTSFPSLSKIKVRVYEPYQGESLVFNYTHGLAKHEGACQRLLHGHTAKITLDKTISLDQLEPALKKLRTPHIASSQQITHQTDTHYSLSYTASEGLYELSIPKTRTWIVDPTASIESITMALYKRILANNPGVDSISVTEGLAKGAMITKK